MQNIYNRLRLALSWLAKRAQLLWKRFRGLRPWLQLAIAIGLVVLLIAALTYLRSSDAPAADDSRPTVSLAPIASLSGTSGGTEVIGTVRSQSEADILAQAGGTVQAIHAAVGQSVPAGFVLAELENASERASVLSAEGAYDAAVAGRDSVSSTNVETQARNAYQSAYASIDSALSGQVDQFFGGPTPNGPLLLINGGQTGTEEFSRQRQAIKDQMQAWRGHLAGAATADPAALLTEAQSVTQKVSSFLDLLAAAANARESGASQAQLAALSSARASVSATLSTLAGAQETYLHGSVSSTASVDASVKQALGALRSAQAALEKTVVRAPLAGVVNYLPIRKGDYVTSLQHVATVAQNGALEVVMNIAPGDRDLIAVGTKLSVDGASGIVTSIAPALDPLTKQIEVHVAVNADAGLIDGQSVRVALPGATPAHVSAAATSSAPLLLPLTAVKLETERRLVFTVDAEGRLVAHPVDIGTVRGDRVEVTSALPGDLPIVVDARGLAEGQQVLVASSTDSL